METHHHRDDLSAGRVDLDLQTRVRQRLLRRRARLFDLAPSPERRRRIAQVDAALRWVDAGLYGRCSVCAAELDRAQLEDDPADMTCLRCKRTAEVAVGRLGPGLQPAVDARFAAPTSSREWTRPADFGLVSLSDDDELRQLQFEAAARAASHD